MKRGKFLAGSIPEREARIRSRRLLWAAELILGELYLGLMWAFGYIHPVPAGIMMALLSGRLCYRLGRYR